MTITAGNIDCGLEKKLSAGYYSNVGEFYSTQDWIVAKTGVYRPSIKLRVSGSSGAARAYLKKVVDGGTDVNLATSNQITSSGSHVGVGTDVTLSAGDKVYLRLSVTNNFNGSGAKAKGALGISAASLAKSNIDRQDAQTGDLMGGTHVGDIFL